MKFELFLKTTNKSKNQMLKSSSSTLEFILWLVQRLVNGALDKHWNIDHDSSAISTFMQWTSLVTFRSTWDCILTEVGDLLWQVLYPQMWPHGFSWLCAWITPSSSVSPRHAYYTYGWLLYSAIHTPMPSWIIHLVLKYQAKQ